MRRIGFGVNLLQKQEVSMGRAVKKYEELTIVDDFMFGKVMRNPKHCRKLLEIILDMKIRKITFIDEQNAVNPDYEAKSIRIDVYVESDEDAVYTVEMQVTNTGELPVRSRYYQSVVDINLIEKGLNYEVLKKNYVIFICTFDLFGEGRHIYHFENLCREDPGIRLEDGTEKVFLNTKGTMDDVDEELRNLLNYFETLMPQDDFTGELDQAVAAAREHKAWRQEYMVLERMMMESRRDGEKEGIIKGKKEGKIEGKKEGGIEKLVGQICRKLAKGKTQEVIAEDLEEELSEVQRICDIAVKYAPEYDTEKILQELLADV